jgi:hypothetical protein
VLTTSKIASPISFLSPVNLGASSLIFVTVDSFFLRKLTDFVSLPGLGENSTVVPAGAEGAGVSGAGVGTLKS